jgi:hypothetical protein
MRDNFEVGDTVMCAFSEFTHYEEKIIAFIDGLFLLKGVVGGWGYDRNYEKYFKIDQKTLEETYVIIRKHRKQIILDDFSI